MGSSRSMSSPTSDQSHHHRPKFSLCKRDSLIDRERESACSRIQRFLQHLDPEHAALEGELSYKTGQMAMSQRRPKLRMEAPCVAGLRSRIATELPERVAIHAWTRPTIPASMAESLCFCEFIRQAYSGISESLRAERLTGEALPVWDRAPRVQMTPERMAKKTKRSKSRLQP
jgi:hypothetical protein